MYASSPGVFYFHVIKLLKKNSFFSIYLISSSGFMFKVNNAKVRKARDAHAKLTVKDFKRQS